MTVHPVERTAAILVGLEGIGIAILAGWQVLALLSGDVEVLTTALALIVLTVVGAAAVIAFAVAIWRGASWGRSGAIVTQLLILAVAVGAATGTYGHPSTGFALGIPAVVTLAVLISSARRSARNTVVKDEEL